MLPGVHSHGTVDGIRVLTWFRASGSRLPAPGSGTVAPAYHSTVELEREARSPKPKAQSPKPKAQSPKKCPLPSPSSVIGGECHSRGGVMSEFVYLYRSGARPSRSAEQAQQ